LNDNGKRSLLGPENSGRYMYGFEYSSVADPGSGASSSGSGNRDPGWVKSKEPDPGSGMNNPDRIY